MGHFPCHAIGLMSGTSLDGLDIALCEISGFGKSTNVTLKKFITIDYPKEVKTEIRKIFAKDTIDFQFLTTLNPWIAQLHAKYILKCLADWNVEKESIDLIASHGQTVMHAPKSLHPDSSYNNATLQIGDGDHLAFETGIITISDFRQKHVAAGGEGAPLALYGDYLLFSSSDENRILLNCGGIANYTFLPKSQDASKAYATDTGPGNTLVDAWTRKLFPGNDYDLDGKIAKTGTVNQALLNALKSHPYFKSPDPKTTGPELFSMQYVEKFIEETDNKNISPNDLLATLVQFSADTVSDSILRLIEKESLDDVAIYLSGGGMHNPLYVEKLKEQLTYPFENINKLGVNGDAKEAILFAVLANETIAGEGINFGDRKGVPSVSMGKISFPR